LTGERELDPEEGRTYAVGGRLSRVLEGDGRGDGDGHVERGNRERREGDGVDGVDGWYREGRPFRGLNSDQGRKACCATRLLRQAEVEVFSASIGDPDREESSDAYTHSFWQRDNMPDVSRGRGDDWE
jgi:hypothetical protein